MQRNPPQGYNDDADDTGFSADDKFNAELLDEICLHDPDNAGEVREMRDSIQAEMIRKLHKARSKVRKMQAEQKAQKARAKKSRG